MTADSNHSSSGLARDGAAEAPSTPDASRHSHGSYTSSDSPASPVSLAAHPPHASHVAHSAHASHGSRTSRTSRTSAAADDSHETVTTTATATTTTAPASTTVTASGSADSVRGSSRSKAKTGGSSRRKRQGQPTVRDVARTAGVAVSTASAVLREDQSCYASDKTRAKVTAAANKLGYRPNRFARALRGTSSMTIGLLFESLAAPTITLTKLAPIEQLAWDAGYRVINANYYSSPRRQREHIQEFVASRVDGLILVTADPLNADIVQQLTEQGLPLVTIDSIYDFPTADVMFDRAHGARLQVEHMLSIGCRKLVFTASMEQTGLAPMKVRGYREALAAHGQKLEDHIVIDLDTPLPQGRSMQGAQHIARLIEEGTRFDGVIASADSVAVGVLQALHQAKLRVPDDVAVIGFDDEDYASALYPPLATIHQPREVGARALQMLLEQIKLKAQGRRWEPVQQKLLPSLVVRESAMRRG